MAQPPSSNGVPFASPSPTPPQDYQHIEATPSEFGGLLAQGGERLGQGLTTATKFYSQVAAQQAVNNWQDQTNKVLYGDPSVPGDAGYYGLHGQAAMDAMPGVIAKLHEAQDNGMDSLALPESQAAFSNDVRFLRARHEAQIGQHYDQQSQIWATGVNKASADIALKGVGQAAMSGDQAAIDRFTDATIGARIKEAQITYGPNLDPAITTDIMNKARADAVTSQVESILPLDPGRAGQVLELNKTRLPPATYDTLFRETQARADQQTVSQNILDITTGAAGGKVRAPLTSIVGPQAAAPVAQHVGFSENDPANQRALAQISNPMMRQAAVDAARRYDIPLPAFVATGLVEGGWNPNNPDGAAGEVGPLQVKPATGQMVGFNLQQLRDPVQNVMAGAAYWRRMQDQSGNNPIAAAGAYNTGAPGQATSDYMRTWSDRYARAGGQAPTLLQPGQTSAARDFAIPPRYFDQMQMINRAYQVAQTLPPRQAVQVLNGVFDQVSHLNSMEDKAEADAQRNLTNLQRDNEATLFGAAAQHQPIDDATLGRYVSSQQISPTAFDAIKAVQNQVAEGKDDPLVSIALWDNIGKGTATSDDIFRFVTAAANGQPGIKGTTGNEMIKALSARSKIETDKVERGDYETLKTTLGGHALESGMMDIFGTGKIAHAELWAQAQQEWNQRVVQRGEKPDAVLGDMLPRYQKAIPNTPASWPNPRMGAVHTVQDVADVAAKTKAAFQGGQIDQSTYNAEGDLLDRYRRAFVLQDQSTAAAKAAQSAGGRRTPQQTAPLAPSDNQ